MSRQAAVGRRAGPRILPSFIRRPNDQGPADIEAVVDALLQLRLAEFSPHEALALARAVSRRDGLGPLSSACHGLLMAHILGLEEEADEALKEVLQEHQGPAEMAREERVM